MKFLAILSIVFCVLTGLMLWLAATKSQVDDYKYTVVAFIIGIITVPIIIVYGIAAFWKHTWW